MENMWWTRKNYQFSLYGIQMKQFGVCTSPETCASAWQSPGWSRHADGRQVQEPVCSQQALCQVYGHTACRCQIHPQKLSTVSYIWDLELYWLSEIIWLIDQKYETYCFIHTGIFCNFVKRFVFFNVVKPYRRFLQVCGTFIGVSVMS